MISLDTYKKKMDKKGVSTYKLIKLTGIKKSTIYSYFNEKSPLTKETCAILADAIGVDVLEAFPDLDTQPKKEKDMTKEAKKKVRPNITLEDMAADAATLVPEDGFTVKSRKVVDHNGMIHDALSVQPETQVIVQTGIKSANVDMERLIVHGLTRHIIGNECHVLPTPITQNGELCVVLYVHGKPLMVCRGIEVAQLMYIPE